jgi:VanZ family protein
VADEVAQSYNPGRVVGLADLAADAIGAVLVVATLALLRERVRVSGLHPTR